MRLKLGHLFRKLPDFWLFFWLERWFGWIGPVADLCVRRSVSRCAYYAERETFRHEGGLNQFERSGWSQNGEDGIIAEIFDRIDAKSHTCVEFGCANGHENCTRALVERDWHALWLDADEQAVDAARALTSGRSVSVIHRKLTAENLLQSLAVDRKIPSDFDLCVIDVDGNDHWLWRTLCERYSPRVLVIEYAAAFPPSVRWKMPYDPEYEWDRTSYQSASLRTLVAIGARLGYTLICCDSNGVNAFFVRNEIANEHFAKLANLPVSQHYRVFKHWPTPSHFGHPPSNRPQAQPVPMPEEDLARIALKRAVLVGHNQQYSRGSPLCVLLEVENGSSMKIGSAGDCPFHLAPRWLDESGEPIDSHPVPRTPLPRTIAPGGSASAATWMRAPDRVGHFTLLCTAVQENVAWLDELHGVRHQLPRIAVEVV